MGKKISLIGTGNMAWHLLNCFRSADIEVLEVYGRNQKEANEFKSFFHTTCVNAISEISDQADVYFICVSDDAISEVLSLLPFRLKSNQLLVHTSGALASGILSPFAEHYGCFWPVQTLTKARPVLTKEIPVVITASDTDVAAQLCELAAQISEQFMVLDDDKKQALHVAAVMVNNFTNHLYDLTASYCREEAVDFQLLGPIIKETALKAVSGVPGQIQTGPAVRNDISTIAKHRMHLKKYPALLKLYDLFTESIIAKFHKHENNWRI